MYELGSKTFLIVNGTVLSQKNQDFHLRRGIRGSIQLSELVPYQLHHLIGILSSLTMSSKKRYRLVAGSLQM